MTKNLLVQRFKDAKNELTALKTTHLRGIGNLRVYKETVPFTAPSDKIDDMIITVTTSQNFAAYPFVYVLGYGVDLGGKYFFSMDADSVNYINDGFGATFEGEAIYYTGWDANKFDVYATSPITSITYRWV